MNSKLKIELDGDLLYRIVVKYTAFIKTLENDKTPNSVIKIVIDDLYLYKGLLRILADTKADNRIAKLYYASISDSKIKALYNIIKDDLCFNYNAATNKISFESSIEEYSEFKIILNNFNYSYIPRIDVLYKIDSDKDPILEKKCFWSYANFNSPKCVAVEQWKKNVYHLSEKITTRSFQHYFVNVYKIVNNFKNCHIDIEKATNDVKKALDANGIILSPMYIRFSLIKYKLLYKPKEIHDEDKNFISIYENIEPIDFNMFGPAALNHGFSILNIVNEKILNLFDNDIGILSRLKFFAENNSFFDLKSGSFNYTNSEGENISEIIKNTNFISTIYSYKLNEQFYNNNLNSNVFFKNYFQSYIVSGIKISILNGFRDLMKNKPLILFNKVDRVTYILSALSLFFNENRGLVKYLCNPDNNLDVYAIELPAMDFSTDFGINIINSFFDTQIAKEYIKIQSDDKDFYNYVDIDNVEIVRNNSIIFDFTSLFQLINLLDIDIEKSKDLFNQLVKTAKSTKDWTQEQKEIIKKGFQKGLEVAFSEFKNLVFESNVLQLLPEKFEISESNFEEKIKHFYINDYIMTTAFLELLNLNDELNNSKRFKERVLVEMK